MILTLYLYKGPRKSKRQIIVKIEDEVPALPMIILPTDSVLLAAFKAHTRNQSEEWHGRLIFQNLIYLN
jgi:hypothetical protein